MWGEREAEGVAGPHLPQQAPRTCRLPVYFHWEMRLPSMCALAKSCRVHRFHLVSLKPCYQLWQPGGSDKYPDLSRQEPLMQPGSPLVYPMPSWGPE